MNDSKKKSLLTSNRSMPESVIIPELGYPDVREAVTWLCSTFGFIERLRIADHRSQLSYGTGSVIVVQQPSVGTITGGTPAHSLMVRVEDVDNHYKHACESGARIVNPPNDYFYGER